MAPHWIALEGTANTRDLGGIPASAGAVADGVVLRSDNLQDLTAADVASLTGEHGVNLVIDLRTPGEIEAEGPSPLMSAGVEHRSFSLVRNPDAAMVREGRILPDRAGVDPADVYLGYLSSMPESMVAACRAVARGDGATIIHCAAGKDRTGLLAAMLLEVAGAPRDAVIADYVATAERIADVVGRLSARPIYAAHVSIDDLDHHTPRERTIRVVLETLESGWGGGAGWLTAHGLDDADLALLRARLSGGEVTP